MKTPRKLTHNLTALSSAAVLAVYGAGYLRTKAAAEKFADDSVPRRAPEFESGLGRMGGPAPQNPAAVSSLTPTASSATMSAGEVSGPASITAAARSTVSVPAAIEPASAPARVQAPDAAPSSAPVGAEAAAASTSAPMAAMSVQPQAAVSAEQAAPAAAQPAAMPAQAPAQSAAVAQPAAPPPPPAPKFKDGSYKGWGTSRHGDIEATVTITGGRIAAAVISQCLTRYSCSWISPLPPQVAARQSPEVDYVSGATQSTYAFYYAVIEALKQAK